MEKQILQEKINMLNQRLRILILQNAREGSVYDDKFLIEIYHVSAQVLALKQQLGQWRQTRVVNRLPGIVPTLVAES